ncbi:MAG: TlpA family protein disulfide reductase [Bacteroidaceae bacterium]|nr:TlpA family protein disulfide reductase [Bacteroidaceae bacterium]
MAPLAWEKYQHHKKWSRILDKRFIDFEVETPDSTIHHLSDYAGKGEYVMLDFWASWCGSCLSTFPMLRELHEKYSKCGLCIISVSVDANPEAWRNTLEKHNLPWLQLRETSETKENGNSASDLYSITGIPSFVLIAPDGKVIYLPNESNHFLDDIHEDIKAKLAEIFGE